MGECGNRSLAVALATTYAIPSGMRCGGDGHRLRKKKNGAAKCARNERLAAGDGLGNGEEGSDQ